MAEESEQEEMAELRELLDKNTQAIEKLREMVAAMEVLLARLSQERAPQPKTAGNPAEPGDGSARA